MELSTWATILMAVAPSISAILTVICGFVALVRTIKSIRNNNDATVGASQRKVKDLERKLNIANNKLASIERLLIEEKDKRGR